MVHVNDMVQRVVLIGLSGTGKTTLSRLAAASLGWTAFDTDAEIERRQGTTIPALFRDLGERAFRSIERTILLDALDRDEVVIATGGGAVNDDEVWVRELLSDPATLVIWLDADPAILVDRLVEQAVSEGEKATRPLLEEGDPLERLSVMRTRRSAAYARADVTLPVDRGDPVSIASDIAELVRLNRGMPSEVLLGTGRDRSTISVGGAAIETLPNLIRAEWPNAQNVWIGVDENVLPHLEHVRPAPNELPALHFNLMSIPSGESSKSLDGLARLFDWMLHGGIERGDVAVAVGGGVVGDLVGFAAASVLRGVGMVQVPTTLLAMVDSSVGGKTGINHAAGKNLIGHFYQPRHVLIDPTMLQTLPSREYRSGWAEIIKHAVIEPSTPGGEDGNLFALLERNSTALASRASPILPLMIRKNVAIKAAVVAADERESGLRAILNFGHTIGHGIEASAYQLLHGEAVALGMCAALTIAREMGRIDQSGEQRVRDLIRAFGLPLTGAFDPVAVRQKMLSDKKKTAGVQAWVLPLQNAGVELRTDVPDALVESAIASVLDASG